MIIDHKYKIFGRTKGRSKKKIDIYSYRKLLNENKIIKYNEKHKYILDIGTGYGETSLYLSKRFQNYKIITCDKYINGNLNLFKNINLNNITNIHVHNCNVHEILDNLENKKFFNKVWIFFPDPWPKSKHKNRRLINNEFLKKIYNFLKDSAEVCIATDSISYSRDIIKSIYVLKNYYKWINQNYIYLDIKDSFDVNTKYYKKAIISGIKPILFILRKI